MTQPTMASRIARISLLTLLGALLISIAIIPRISFALEGTACQTTKGEKLPDEGSSYIQVEIPIPGVTKEVICMSNNEALPKVYAVADLGDYIAGVYQYFVSFVGILAVTMIMYAGVRWILAAGNQSRIAGAKSIISSAIIGVVIAFCSYLLLFLLNPATVDLGRLSSTFSSLGINLTNIGVQGFTCAELPKETLVQIESVGLACRMSSSACSENNVKGRETKAGDVGCGSLAVVVDPNAKAPAKLGGKCVGTVCGSNGTCIMEQCIVGFLAGTIDWTGNAYVDKLWIDGFCTDGTVEKGQTNNTNEGTHFYKFADQNAPEGGSRTIVSDLLGFEYSCASHGGLAGYGLRIEVNDDGQTLGGKVLPTYDDEFYVDRFGKVIDGSNGEKDPSSFSVESRRGIVSSGRLFVKSDFFQAAGKVCFVGSRTGQACTSDSDCPDTGLINPPFCLDRPLIKQSPYVVNLSINRQDFPAR